MSSLWEKMGRGMDDDDITTLPAQFPADAPRRMHKIYYDRYIASGFAEDFLKDKGMKVTGPYMADSFEDYLKIRGIGKAYGGKVQPRRAMQSVEKP